MPIVPNSGITASKLKEKLRYDPMTGLFTWVRVRRRLPGSIAGTVQNRGYIIIKIDQVRYQASRLAFLYMTGRHPLADMDHRNGVRTDNRWGNLREASRSQNLRNAGRRDRPLPKGVTMEKRRGRLLFRATIHIGNQQKFLGYYYTVESAHHAYAEAAAEHFGEFARVA